MIIVLLAEGFEEIEALMPVDLLRRAGHEVKTVGIESKTVTGSHGISVIADAVPSEIDLDKIKLAIFPGGMPGALNLDASTYTDEVIRAVVKNGGRLAAICAAPLVFGRRGLLDGKSATCFEGFENELRGAFISKQAVVTDGMITTSNGMVSAYKFAEELVRLMTPAKKVSEVKADVPDEEEPVIEDEEAKKYYALIRDTFDNFNVKVKVELDAVGPRIYRFAVFPAKGVKVNSVTNLFQEIQLNLGVEGMRMEAPILGKAAIGIEVPRKNAEIVYLNDLLSDHELEGKSSTTVPIGRSVTGAPVYVDVARLPHLIVGGATGMGKGILMNSIIVSLAKRCAPSELKMILIDPKRVEYGVFSNLPHLLCPIVTSTPDTVGALAWAVNEMENRYGLLEKLNVRNIDSYNAKIKEDSSLGNILPRIVIFIDELTDIMMPAKSDVECRIMSIAQKARAAGIHIIIGTQRPTVDVLTGVIKANIPARISCKVASYIDSKTILEQAGAEKLLSRGDMLFLPVGAPSAMRVQGAFISDSEIKGTVEELVGKFGEPTLISIPPITPGYTASDEEEDEEESILTDKLFLEALELAVRSGKISTSLIQRKLRIGYSKSAMFLDYMEDFGIISAMNGSKPRDVLINEEELKEFLKNHK